MKYLFFDTETTGLPRNYKAPVTDAENWPRLVQLAWILCEADGTIVEQVDHIIKPDGWTIGKQASDIHGITTERAMTEGIPLDQALKRFARLLYDKGVTLVAHNIDFDHKIVGAELHRLAWPVSFNGVPMICTMKASTNYCAIKSEWGYKWPKLQELHRKLFASNFNEAHNAAADIAATVKCFFELKRLKILTT